MIFLGFKLYFSPNRGSFAWRELLAFTVAYNTNLDSVRNHCLVGYVTCGTILYTSSVSTVQVPVLVTCIAVLLRAHGPTWNRNNVSHRNSIDFIHREIAYYSTIISSVIYGYFCPALDTNGSGSSCISGD